MGCVGRQKPPISVSLISYLQTGAWQGRSSTLELNEAVWQRAGMSMIFRQDQKRSRHSSSPALPPSLHWSGNDRFHSSFCSWRRRGVRFPGWCRGRWCRTKTRNAALSNSNRSRVSRGKAEEFSSTDPINCLRDSKRNTWNINFYWITEFI